MRCLTRCSYSEGKDKHITLLNKKLNIATIEPVQTLELRQAHEESEKNYANMLHFHKLSKDRAEKNNEPMLQIAT